MYRPCIDSLVKRYENIHALLVPNNTEIRNNLKFISPLNFFSNLEQLIE